jgi:hypothetical protein
MTTPTNNASDKETRLANALSGLSEKEAGAYRYFVKAKQAPISEDRADEMFELYLQGADCDEIRKRVQGFGLGQIVAARVMYGWDSRRGEYRRDLETQVPVRAAQVHLEQVDFISDLLTASQVSTRKKIREYLATGNEKLLEGLPLPKTIKDYKELVQLFMTATGQDKKRIEVTGKVTIDNATGTANQVTAAEASRIMDDILGEEDVDTEVPTPTVGEEPPRALGALPVAVDVPKTHDEMVAYLVKTGVRPEKAEALVASMDNDVKRYAELVEALVKDQADGKAN